MISLMFLLLVDVDVGLEGICSVVDRGLAITLAIYSNAINDSVAFSMFFLLGGLGKIVASFLYGFGKV